MNSVNQVLIKMGQTFEKGLVRVKQKTPFLALWCLLLGGCLPNGPAGGGRPLFLIKNGASVGSGEGSCQEGEVYNLLILGGDAEFHQAYECIPDGQCIDSTNNNVKEIVSRLDGENHTKIERFKNSLTTNRFPRTPSKTPEEQLEQIRGQIDDNNFFCMAITRPSQEEVFLSDDFYFCQKVGNTGYRYSANGLITRDDSCRLKDNDLTLFGSITSHSLQTQSAIFSDLYQWCGSPAGGGGQTNCELVVKGRGQPRYLNLDILDSRRWMAKVPELHGSRNIPMVFYIQVAQEGQRSTAKQFKIPYMPLNDLQEDVYPPKILPLAQHSCFSRTGTIVNNGGLLGSGRQYLYTDIREYLFYWSPGSHDRAFRRPTRNSVSSINDYFTCHAQALVNNDPHITPIQVYPLQLTLWKNTGGAPGLNQLLAQKLHNIGESTSTELFQEFKGIRTLQSFINELSTQDGEGQDTEHPPTLPDNNPNPGGDPNGHASLNIAFGLYLNLPDDCPGRQEYYGPQASPTHRALGEVLNGVETEAFYYAAHELDDMKSIMPIRESTLKKLAHYNHSRDNRKKWAYVQGVSQEDSEGLGLCFYWPPVNLTNRNGALTGQRNQDDQTDGPVIDEMDPPREYCLILRTDSQGNIIYGRNRDGKNQKFGCIPKI